MYIYYDNVNVLQIPSNPRQTFQNSFNRMKGPKPKAAQKMVYEMIQVRRKRQRPRSWRQCSLRHTSSCRHKLSSFPSVHRVLHFRHYISWLFIWPKILTVRCGSRMESPCWQILSPSWQITLVFAADIVPTAVPLFGSPKINTCGLSTRELFQWRGDNYQSWPWQK